MGDACHSIRLISVIPGLRYCCMELAWLALRVDPWNSPKRARLDSDLSVFDVEHLHSFIHAILDDASLMLSPLDLSKVGCITLRSGQDGLSKVGCITRGQG